MDDEVLENIKSLAAYYRKTDVYKRQRDSFVYDMPNWAEWLYERVKKKRGEINASEALFWGCFLFEDSHLKIWLEYLRANGNIDHKYNAENSLEILSQIISKENIGQVYKEPQPEQAAPEPQQEKLHYCCQKAIEKKYLIKVGDGYRLGTWKKAQLAYFLKHFPNADGTFPDKYYSKMFGENRLSKAADQLSMNKLGDGKPRGYGEVDELLQE